MLRLFFIATLLFGIHASPVFTLGLVPRALPYCDILCPISSVRVNDSCDCSMAGLTTSYSAESNTCYNPTSITSMGAASRKVSTLSPISKPQTKVAPLCAPGTGTRGHPCITTIPAISIAVVDPPCPINSSGSNGFCVCDLGLDYFYTSNSCKSRDVGCPRGSKVSRSHICICEVGVFNFFTNECDK